MPNGLGVELDSVRNDVDVGAGTGENIAGATRTLTDHEPEVGGTVHSTLNLPDLAIRSLGRQPTSRHLS